MEKALRKNWIDWAKALGILLVVMGHSNYSQADINPMIFMVHMPLFFVASGYLYKTNKSIREITRSNIRTLLIPYALFNLIYLIYLSATSTAKQYIGGDGEWQSAVIEPLYNTAFGIPGNLLCGPTWFLLALIWCKYIVYGFERGGVYLRYSILLLWAIALILIQVYFPESPLSFNGGITGCIWFGVGYYSRKYSDSIHLNKWIWYFAIPVTFAICLHICRLQGNCNYLNGNIRGVIGMIGTAAGLISYYGICNLLDKVQSRWIAKVSQASIVIMCLHMLIMPNLQKLTHYQYHIGITLLGDVAIVLVLTAIFPLLKKYFPALIGYRK